MKSSPIGVFDSGIGGLSVVFEMNKILPKENIEYFADHARQPYGLRNKDEIANFVMEIIQYLLLKDIKACIIGCNTATAAGLQKARHHFKIPIVGVIEAGAKAAAKATKSGRIGLIGTDLTVKSEEHLKEIKKIDSEIEVIANPCPEFCPLVESGKIETEETYTFAQEYLDSIKKENIDTLILGCTHYPFLSKVIQDITGPQVSLINPAHDTVLEIKEILKKKNLLIDSQNERKENYYTTGNPEDVNKIANLITDDKKYQFRKVKI